MKYIYNTCDTCSTQISFDINDDIVRNIEFTGGCSGNLKAIQKLAEGYTVGEISKTLGGITCGGRATSCADQLSKAVTLAHKYLNEEKKQ